VSLCSTHPTPLDASLGNGTATSGDMAPYPTRALGSASCARWRTSPGSPTCGTRFPFPRTLGHVIFAHIRSIIVGRLWYSKITELPNIQQAPYSRFFRVGLLQIGQLQFSNKLPADRWTRACVTRGTGDDRNVRPRNHRCGFAIGTCRLTSQPTTQIF